MNSRQVTGTALLLALAVLSQNLRLFIPIPNGISMFLIGSLVGACLILATRLYGLWSGLIIACITPLIAFMQGMLKLAPLIPIVAVGSSFYCIVAYILKDRHLLMTLVAASFAKAIIMFLGTMMLLQLVVIPEAVRVAILFPMSWPQFVTGALGVVLAILILRRIENGVS